MGARGTLIINVPKFIGLFAEKKIMKDFFSRNKYGKKTSSPSEQPHPDDQGPNPFRNANSSERKIQR